MRGANLNTVRITILLAALTGLLLAVGTFFGGMKGTIVMLVASCDFDEINHLRINAGHPSL